MPSHPLSLENFSLSALSNSPIGYFKIAQLHSFFFPLSPCCSLRGAVHFLFLRLGSVNKMAKPYLTIPKCMQVFFNGFIRKIWLLPFCAFSSLVLLTVILLECHNEHDVLRVIMVNSLSFIYITFCDSIFIPRLQAFVLCCHLMISRWKLHFRFSVLTVYRPFSLTKFHEIVLLFTLQLHYNYSHELISERLKLFNNLNVFLQIF